MLLKYFGKTDIEEDDMPLGDSIPPPITKEEEL